MTPVLVLILLLLLPVSYLFKKWQSTYWIRKGVPNPGETILVNNYPYSEIFGKFYDEFKSKGKKFYGIFSMEPVFVPIDIDLVKNILHMDYSHFESHGIYVNEKHDPMTGNIFRLEGERWRNLRNRLSPTFTSGRIKTMFGIVLHCAQNLVDVLKQQNGPIDIKEYFSQYNIDIISSAAFGVECNCLKNPNSEFREYSIKYIHITSRKLQMILWLQTWIPEWLFKMTRLRTIAKDVEDFFYKLVTSTVDYREKNNVFRNDFLQLLIQLKNHGKLADDEELSTKNGQSGLTIDEMVAQCVIFFLAGFETSSTSLTFALFELSQDLDIQGKLRQEINEVLDKYDGEVSYEAMMEMEYLDMVMNEALRKFPVLVVYPRKCTKTYKVPNSNVIIEKGTSVAVPVYSIHRDPEYWPEPEKFDPERFRPGKADDRPTFSYMPFGGGPRICLGSRFGKVQIKMALIHIIRDFVVTLNEKTQLPIKLAPSHFLTMAAGPIWLNLRKVK